MKTPRSFTLFSLLLLFSFAATAGAEIQVGTARAEVVQILGEPTGHIGSNAFQIYYFERGEVVFRNGLVESHSVISQAELDQKIADREKRREEKAAARVILEERRAEERAILAERRAEERAARIVEGTEIRDQRRADPVFSTSDASTRLAFWQAFRRKYPEVDATFEYSVALQEVNLAENAKQAEYERQVRIVDLERRVEQAEQQASDARQQASEARRQASLAEQKADRNVYRYNSYPYPVNRRPIIITPNRPHSNSNRHDYPNRHDHSNRHSSGNQQSQPGPTISTPVPDSPRANFEQAREEMKQQYIRNTSPIIPSRRGEVMR